MTDNSWFSAVNYLYTSFNNAFAPAVVKESKRSTRNTLLFDSEEALSHDMNTSALFQDWEKEKVLQVLENLSVGFKTRLEKMENKTEADFFQDILGDEVLLNQVVPRKTSMLTTKEGLKKCKNILEMFDIQDKSSIDLICNIITPLSKFIGSKENRESKLSTQIEKFDNDDLIEFMKQELSAILIKHSNYQAVITGETIQLVIFSTH